MKEYAGIGHPRHASRRSYLVEYVSESVDGQRFRVVDDVRLFRGHESDAHGVEPADGTSRAHSFVVHVYAHAV